MNVMKLIKAKLSMYTFFNDINYQNELINFLTSDRFAFNLSIAIINKRILLKKYYCLKPLYFKVLHTLKDIS